MSAGVQLRLDGTREIPAAAAPSPAVVARSLPAVLPLSWFSARGDECYRLRSRRSGGWELLAADARPDRRGPLDWRTRHVGSGVLLAVDAAAIMAEWR